MSAFHRGCVKTLLSARNSGFRADHRKIAPKEFNDLEDSRNPRLAVEAVKIDLRLSFHTASTHFGLRLLEKAIAGLLPQLSCSPHHHGSKRVPAMRGLRSCVRQPR